MLATLLHHATIRVQVPATDWQTAVRAAVQPLIDNSTVEPSYYDKIVATTLELGPYYVIAPGFAMPHARPEDGVNRMGLSLITLAEAVPFGNEDNDPVKLLITLAATDGTSHIEAIVGITKLLENEADVAAINTASDVDDVISIVQKY